MISRNLIYVYRQYNVVLSIFRRFLPLAQRYFLILFEIQYPKTAVNIKTYFAVADSYYGYYYTLRLTMETFRIETKTSVKEAKTLVTISSVFSQLLILQ